MSRKSYCPKYRFEYDDIFCPKCGVQHDCVYKCSTPTCKVAIFAGDMFGPPVDDFGKPAKQIDMDWYCSQCANRAQNGYGSSDPGRAAATPSGSAANSRSAPGSEGFEFEPGSPAWELQRTLDRLNAEDAARQAQAVGNTARPQAGRPQVARSTATSSRDFSTGLVENTTWRYGVTDGDAKAFSLSTPVDHFEYSKAITELSPGEFYVFYFKVVEVTSGGKFAHGLEILNGKEKPSGWVFDFVGGRDRIKNGKLRLNGEYRRDKSFDVDWYQPGKWNKVRLCYRRDEHLYLQINGSYIERHLISGKGTFPLITRVVGMTVVFDG